MEKGIYGMYIFHALAEKRWLRESSYSGADNEVCDGEGHGDEELR